MFGSVFVGVCRFVRVNFHVAVFVPELTRNCPTFNRSVVVDVAVERKSQRTVHGKLFTQIAEKFICVVAPCALGKHVEAR